MPDDPNQALIEQHRRLRDQADTAGHDGERMWHETQVDALIEAAAHGNPA